MIYIKVLTAIAVLGSIGWVIAAPGFEPAISVAVTFSALISVFLVEKRNARRANQQQSVSKTSIGVQAGGDVSIGNIGSNKHAE